MENNTSLMILHSGATEVTREALHALPAPAKIGAWHRPIPHAEVVDSLFNAFPVLDLKPMKEQYGLSKDGARLFGLVQFDRGDADGALTLGFRSSTDESLALRGVAGRTVFVCDNLALSGEEFVFSRKHTLYADVRQVVERGLEKFRRAAETFEEFLRRLRGMPLTDLQASHVFIKMLVDETLPDRTVSAAVRHYFSPPASDCEPRSGWGVHNAVTRALRESSLRTKMDQGVALSRFMEQRLLAA